MKKKNTSGTGETRKLKRLRRKERLFTVLRRTNFLTVFQVRAHTQARKLKTREGEGNIYCISEAQFEIEGGEVKE